MTRKDPFSTQMNSFPINKKRLSFARVFYNHPDRYWRKRINKIIFYFYYVKYGARCNGIEGTGGWVDHADGGDGRVAVKWRPSPGAVFYGEPR